MTEEQGLILKQLLIQLTTAQVRQIWPSGNALRQWAKENDMRVTVSKDSVELRR